MKNFPHAATEREAIRAFHIEREAVRAMRDAVRYGLSMRCRWGDHGCLNDGSTCLCRCHDRKPE